MRRHSSYYAIVKRPLRSVETCCFETTCHSPYLDLLFIDIEQSSTKYEFYGKDCEIRLNGKIVSESLDEGTFYKAELNHISIPRLLLHRGEFNPCLGNFLGMDTKSPIRPVRQHANVKHPTKYK
jgi:hypothetical protein